MVKYSPMVSCCTRHSEAKVSLKENHIMPNLGIISFHPCPDNCSLVGTKKITRTVSFDLEWPGLGLLAKMVLYNSSSCKI